MKTTNMTCVARWMIAALFIISGLSMLANYSATVGWMSAAGVPMVSVLLPIALLIKIVGGVVYAMGKKYSKEAGYALVLFTVVATVIGHTNPLDQNNIIQILKNLAIIGGLLATTPCICGGTCPMCKECEAKKA